MSENFVSNSEKQPLSTNNNNGDSSEEDSHQGKGGIMQKIMPHGGVLASCFSFAAASMGAGTLGLPSAMQAAGALLGSLMLLLVCASTVYSIRLLIIVFEKTGNMTYESMANGLFGRWMEKLTAFLIVAFCWGVTIAYIVAIGDVMEKLSAAEWFPYVFTGKTGSQILTIMYWGILLMPLSLALEINSLRYASTFGVCSSAFLVTCIVVHSATAGPEVAKANLTYAEFDVNMIVAMPIFIFSYCCQANAFEIYTEMKPRTVKQMTINASLAMSICTTIYIAAGVAGFANFGAATHGNILNNLDPLKSVYVAMAYFAITMALTAAFPLCIFPTRDAILQVLGYRSAYYTPSSVRILLCASLSWASLLCGLYVPGIKVLFGVLGGLCGSSLAFIWPALFYLKCVGGSLTRGREKTGTANFVASWLMIIVGVVAGGLGTVVSLVQTFE